MSSEKEEPLTEEEFFATEKGRPEEYVGVNFSGLWGGGLASASFRQNSIGKRFQEDHPELDGELTSLIGGQRENRFLANPETKRRIYQAYRILHEEYSMPHSEMALNTDVLSR
jgi:hypothetical protein